MVWLRAQALISLPRLFFATVAILDLCSLFERTVILGNGRVVVLRRLQRCHQAGGQTHLPRTTFSHVQLLHRRVFTCCQSVQSHHTLTSMHLHGSSHEAHCLRFAQKHSHFILVAQCRTFCRTCTTKTVYAYLNVSEILQMRVTAQACNDATTYEPYCEFLSSS